MAKVVSIIGVTHNPLLAGMGNPGIPPDLVRVRERFAEQRAKLREAKPDVLLCVGNDHFNYLFMDNMPAFMVGKSPTAKGTTAWERRIGLPDYATSVNVELAKNVIREGFKRRTDFAFSDEFVMDHAFTFPLTHLRPEADLPIVPIFCNVMAPPIPTAERFYQVGETLRQIIEDLPGDLRVAALCSGHLSVEIGGPRPANPDKEFDDWAMALVGQGRVKEALEGLTFERFSRAGNYTAGFLTFVMQMGIARGQPATFWECMSISAPTETRVPFLRWDLF